MIKPYQWNKYFELRRTGTSMRVASNLAKISYASAKARERKLKGDNGETYQKLKMELYEQDAPHAIPYEQLSDEAKKAWNDFAYFRRRYLGRISTPWQEEAAYKIVDFLETKTKEYVVINCPPGSGKSTLFVMDIPLWLTVRNRGIRGLIGSASQSLAEKYLVRLRTQLETPFLAKAEDAELQLGLAVDAEASMIRDFGLFRSKQMWTNKAIITLQHGDRPISEKEPTWSAFGLETEFIGGRYDICLWDDAVSDRDLVTAEGIEKTRRRWDSVAEKRLEPGGVLILQGQRLGPDDLYRHALDKASGGTTIRQHSNCCSQAPNKRYHHIVYKSHFEDRCDEKHGEDSLYYPDGCLLDPRRVSWEELIAEQENNPGNYMQVYQQEDADPASALVQQIWVTGGMDPKTREVFPGCWDDDRGLCELPRGLNTRTVSVASTDPSPAKFWATSWWVIAPELELRYFMDLERKTMQLPEFIDWDGPGQYSGLMEDWWQRSNDMGYPIRYWIIEDNAAQRFMLQLPQIRDWARYRGVQLISHNTNRRKADPKFGPQILGSLYRYGKIRFPGKQGPSRFIPLKLIDEAKKWPQGAYDDCVMSQWFVEANMHVLAPKTIALQKMSRPSWMRERVS